MELQASISAEINRKYLHRTLETLIEIPPGEGKAAFGRGRFQAPEVDGVILLKDGGPLTGRKIRALEKVEIVDTDVYDLHGRLVS